MRSRAGVVIDGVVAGLVIAVSPSGAIPLVALCAAALAGVLLSHEPMVAAALVLAPTVVVALVRTVMDSDRNVGAVILSLVSALFITAVVTHVSAGLALRRRA